MIDKKYRKTSVNSTLPRKKSELLDKIYKENKDVFDQIKDIFPKIKEKYNVRFEDLIKIVEEPLTIPTSIFCDELSSLEAIVKYLKENIKLNYHDIASLLGRDERNIWHTYHYSLKKHPGKLSVEKTRFSIPIQVLKQNKLSVLESLVQYLKQEFNLRYSEISVLLHRDTRTIWTIYKRALKKNE